MFNPSYPTQSYGFGNTSFSFNSPLSLCSAIQENKPLLEIRSLINSQSIQNKDQYGNTPLALAIGKKDLTLTQELLQAGAQINTTPELKACVEQQDPQLLKLLLDRLDTTQRIKLINTRFYAGGAKDSTLLYYACSSDCMHKLLSGFSSVQRKIVSAEIINLLLQAGAEAIVKCGDKKETPLHAALYLHTAGYKGGGDIVSILLKHAPKLIETQDGEGATPLYRACKGGCGFENELEQIINLLIGTASQADIHHGPNGQTTLHAAVQHLPSSYGPDNDKRLKIVSKLVLSYPSLINIPDKEGRTPLYYASKQCHAGFIRLLLEAKANIICSSNNETALFTALKAKIETKTETSLTSFGGPRPSVLPTAHDRLSAITIILELNKEVVHVKDKDNNSPLYYACKNLGTYDYRLDITSKLLAAGANAEEYNGLDQETVLHAVVKNSSSYDSCLPEQIPLLHKYQPKLIHLKDKNGLSPLYYACQKQNPELIKFFLDSQVATNERYGSDEDTVLHSVLKSSTYYRDNEAVSRCLLFLINKNPSLINIKDKQGKTALYYACQKNNDRAVTLLIEQGAIFNEKYGPLEESLLHVVLRKKTHTYLPDQETIEAITNILNILFKKDKNLIHTKDKEGYTPLYYACEQRLSSAVIFLLTAGAEIVCGPDGQTALHAAVKTKITRGLFEVGPPRKQEEVTVISYLLTKYPNLINQADKNGYTPLYYACQYGTKENFDSLIQAGAKIEENYGANKETLFHALMQRSRSEDQTAILSYLIKHQSHLINHKDGRGFTALYYACQQGNKGAVQLFIDAQAHTDIRCGAKDETLFHVTARGYLSEHASILSLLIEKQSPLLNHKNKEGLTALDYAYQQGCKDVIQILLSNGALSTTQPTMQVHSSKTENILSDKLDFTSLSQLDLSNLGITENNLSEIKDMIQKCSKLQTLHLNHNPIGDRGVQILSSILEGKPIVQLQLINIGMTDIGLQVLCKTVSKLDTIQRLALSSNPFTDVGLEHLRQALVGKKLETISIDNSKCTGVGIAKFFA